MVTLFLRHFQIPLDDEPFVQVNKSFAVGVGVVTSFGYRKDRDGQWLKKDALPLQDKCTPSPPPQRNDSTALMNEVLSELRGLRTYVGERFDSIPWMVALMAWIPTSPSLKRMWVIFIGASIFHHLLSFRLLL